MSAGASSRLVRASTIHYIAAVKFSTSVCVRKLRKRKIPQIREAAIIAVRKQRDGLVTFAFASFAFVHLLTHFRSDSLSFLDPFLPILLRIVEVLVATDTKDATFFQFLGQWDNIIVQESNFALVPVFGRVRVDPPFAKCIVQLFVEALVPLPINLPVGGM